MEEYDLIVIGSGPGGYVAAIKGAQEGLKTLCIEKDPYLGGTCLNVGCIPSKALLRSTEVYHEIKTKGGLHGIECSALSMNFATLMKRKEGVIDSFRIGVQGLFKKNGVALKHGLASFIDPHTLLVKSDSLEEQVKAKYIIIATGSEPAPLPFISFDEKTVLSSTGALSLSKPPSSLLLIGAGVIGVEIGSIYQRLGTQVTCLEFLDRVTPTMDKDISREFQKILEKQGMKFHLSTKVTKAQIDQNGVTLFADSMGKESSFSAEKVLVAIGRKPYAQHLGLDKINLPLDRGFIPVNGSFQTLHPHIFAIGDVIGGMMLAHKASEEAIAVIDLITNHPNPINYAAIPSVIYTDPEVASVGFSEEELIQNKIPYKKGQFPFKANSRAKAALQDEGFVKILSHAVTSHLLGIHIIGAHAGELIQEGALALHKKLTVSDIAYTSHAHPAFTEALKEAALANLKKPIHL